MALKVKVDFTNVKESSGINPKHVESGDYLATITKVEQTQSKAGNEMLLFVFQLNDQRSVTYPYYVVLDEKNLWKLRNLLLAVGAKVPKGAANIDVERLVGKVVGISLEDDEYEGQMKSVIDAVFSKDEVESEDAPAMEEDDEDEDDDIEEVEEEEEPPAKKKKSKPVEDDEDDDEIEIDL